MSEDLNKERQVIIDYCASGFIGFTGLNDIMKFAIENKKREYIDYVVSAMHKLRDMYKNVGINMSVMFNAQYEQKNAYMIGELRKHGFDMEVHADSGGLQVMTLGLDLEKEKPKIFACQGEYANLAMSFDEMPNIKVGTGNLKMVQLSSKKSNNMYFVKELAYLKGLESSKNIVSQIEEFIKQGTDTKLIVILQGHNLEDYNEYARGAYTYIPEEYYDRIHGISFGGTAFQRFDDLVDIYLRFQKDLTAVPKQHLRQVHILGTTSLERLFPIMIMAKTGYYEPFTFSFDATSHASASTWGRWTELRENGTFSTVSLGGFKMNKRIHKHTLHMYEELKDHMKILGINSYDDMLENLTPFNSKNKRLRSEIENPEERIRIASLYSFNCFVLESSTYLKIVNNVVNNDLFSVSTNNKHRKLAGSLLKNLKSYEDYRLHEKEIRKALRVLRPRKINYVNTMAEIEHLINSTENTDSWDEWN